MPDNQTVKQYFQSLRIVHLALISGLVLFALVINFVSENEGFGDVNTTLTTVLEIASMLFLILGFFGGAFLFKSKIKVIKRAKSLSEKLISYKAVLIVRYALLEGPAFFALIAYLLTSNELFLVIVALVIFIFILLRPGPFMASKHLELDHSESMILQEPSTPL